MNHDVRVVSGPLRPGQVSTLLPREARAQLQAAASISPLVEKGLCLERTFALDEATAQIKKDHPQFFR